MAISREVKVGAFVLAGLVALGGVIFAIGEERQLFQRKLDYKTSFGDVQGLRPGSPVRMGGVDIGTVSRVSYAQDPSDRKIHVVLSILSEQAVRIKVDSVATIEGKGLLGDKMISVSLGSTAKPHLPEGGVIPSKEADDFGQMLSKLGSISATAEKVAENLHKASETLADATLQDDLKGTISSLNAVVGSLERREGYVGKLLSDPAEAERLSKVVKNLDGATAELQRTAAQASQILERVRTGPGLAHEVLYSQESANTVAQFGGAAEELRLTLKGIRDGNGVAKSLIYGDDGSQALLANLNAASDDIRQIVADMRAGKGTLGALLIDPSVYEDLKVVLGNVERNRALRALVRYSIRRDEASGVAVRDAAPAKPAPASASASAKTESVASDATGSRAPSEP